MALRADIFYALGDPTRLKIVERLGERGPLTTSELTNDLGMTRQGASKHLEVLQRAGLVSERPEGRTVVRELQLDRLAEAADYLTLRARAWDSALNRLKRFVEMDSGDPVEAQPRTDS